MSATLLEMLVREIARLLAPINDAVENPNSLDRILAEIGVMTPFDDGELTAALGAVVNLKTRLDELAALPAPSLDSIAALLDVSRDVFAAVRSLRDLDEPVSALQGFGQDFADLLVTAYLARWHPLARNVAALATLIEPAEELDPRPPVVHGDQLMREPFSLDRFHFDRLVSLVREPVLTLRTEYGNALATADDASVMAQKLFPRLQRVLRGLGVPCRYGFDPDDEVLFDDAAPLMKHALIVYTEDMLGGAAAEAGIVLSLSSADRGDLGLIVSPFGTLTSTKQVGRWVLDLRLTAEVDVLAYGRHGLTLLASAETTEVAGGLSATLMRLDNKPGFIFGAPDGTRIEVGGARLAIDTSLSEARQSLVLSGDVSSSALVISPGNGDGFLSSILPADGMRADFDLGLAWSNERGLTFRGAGGLDSTLPVGPSIGGVTVPTIHLRLHAGDADLLAEVSASVGVSIGPVRALVDRVGIETLVTFPETGGNLGPVDLDVGFKPPSGIGLEVAAGPVSGGGFLSYDAAREQYAGAMQLELSGIMVKALGVLTTRLPGGAPGFSLLVVISAEFTPVQLGLGFTLKGVGGLLGINRTVAVEALRAGLKTDALRTVLSPPDPVANAGQLIAVLSDLFPPAAGRHVFGPIARIGWGSPELITIDLCLVLELPAPVRLVLLGRLRAVLPDEREAIVRLQMDLLGVIEFDRRDGAAEATLVDSRLASFALTGDMAMRMSWGAQPSFLLAVGGFHPRFAAPPGFPRLERVAVALATDDNPRLRLEAYLALTSNTVQFGARVDLSAQAGRFTVAGFLSFDALVQLKPLAFEVDVAAQLAVKAGGHAILSVSLALTLSGPEPWRARGLASFSILFFDISFRFDVTIGSDRPPALPSSIDVAPLLLATLADVRSWDAQLPPGGEALVTLRTLPATTEVLAHPLGTLQVRQRVTPLERTLERFGSDAPAGAKRFAITQVTIGAERADTETLEDHFAPGQFRALSDAQKLALPSFESMPSGVRIGKHEVDHGAPVDVEIVFEQRIVAAPGITPPAPPPAGIPGDVLFELASAPRARAATPTFALRQP